MIVKSDWMRDDHTWDYGDYSKPPVSTVIGSTHIGYTYTCDVCDRVWYRHFTDRHDNIKCGCELKGAQLIKGLTEELLNGFSIVGEATDGAKRFKCSCGEETYYANYICKTAKCYKCKKHVLKLSASKITEDIVGKTINDWMVISKEVHKYRVTCANGVERVLQKKAITEYGCICEKCSPNRGHSHKPHGTLWRSLRDRQLLSEEWQNFYTFVETLPEGYQKGYTLVRKDTTKPHGADNSLWCYSNQDSYDKDQIIAKEVAMWGSFDLLSIKGNMITIRCHDCGEVFSRQKESALIQSRKSNHKYACAKCREKSGDINRNKRELAQKNFVPFIDKFNKSLEENGLFTTNDTPSKGKDAVTLVCKTCGEAYKTTADKAKDKRKCSKCLLVKYLKSLQELSSDTCKIELVGKFNGAYKTKYRCVTHERDFYREGSGVFESGCPACATFSIDPNEPCNLYYIRIQHEGRNYYKIGITTQKVRQRFSGLMRDIKILSVKKFDKASDAYDEEQRILKQYQEHRLGGEIDLLKGNGRTECFYHDVLGLDTSENSA